MELAGVNVGRMSDTGTVGKNTSSSSPKPSNSQPPQNGSNKKPDENKGIGNSKWKSAELLDELANSGVKYNPDEVMAITKTASSKLAWLEKGNSNAGFEHVMRHADEFAAKGIKSNEIPDFLMEALSKGKVVGTQGRGNGRPIYEVVFNGQKQRVAITVGNNGFIVGANPKSIP